MLGDILDDILKESWVYKEWTQEANKQGKKEGLKQALMAMVQTRFAPLAPLAKERSALLKTPEELQLLFTRLMQAQDEKEALRLLLAEDEK